MIELQTKLVRWSVLNNLTSRGRSSLLDLAPPSHCGGRMVPSSQIRVYHRLGCYTCPVSNCSPGDTTGLHWVWGEGRCLIISGSNTCELGSVYEQPHHCCPSWAPSCQFQSAKFLNATSSMAVCEVEVKTGISPTSPQQYSSHWSLCPFFLVLLFAVFSVADVQRLEARVFPCGICTCFHCVCVSSSSHGLKRRRLNLPEGVSMNVCWDSQLVKGCNSSLSSVTRGDGPQSMLESWKPLDIIEKKKLHCWGLRAFKTDYWYFCMNWQQLLIFKLL